MRKFLVFLFILLALVACGGGEGVPEIVLETAELALDDVPNGEIVERTVTVRNDGGATLVVEKVMTSCGCTSAVLEPMTLGPGESGVLSVAFDSGAHGPDLRGPLMRQMAVRFPLFCPACRLILELCWNHK